MAQADFTAIIDIENLHGNGVSFTEGDIVDVLDALIGDFGDVAESLFVINSDEESEGDERGDDSCIGLANLYICSEVEDDLFRALHCIGIHRGDVDNAVISHFADVDLHAGLFLDCADLFATRTDDDTDLAAFDFHRLDARCMRGHLLFGFWADGKHGAQNVCSALFCLRESFLHDLDRDAFDFDVHLERGEAFGVSSDLKVHIAERIFCTEDVGKDRKIVAFQHESHCDARYRTADWYARFHECEAAAADRSHRGGAVRFEDIGLDSNHVGELVLAWQNRQQRAFREFTVTHFAAARGADTAHFADGKGREEVLQVEALGIFAL